MSLDFPLFLFWEIIFEYMYTLFNVRMIHHLIYATKKKKKSFHVYYLYRKVRALREKENFTSEN